MHLQSNQLPSCNESAAASRGRRLLNRMKWKRMMGPCPTKSISIIGGEISIFVLFLDIILKIIDTPLHRTLQYSG